MRTEDLDEMTVNEVKRTLEYQKYESNYNFLDMTTFVSGTFLCAIGVVGLYLLNKPILLFPSFGGLGILIGNIIFQENFRKEHFKRWGFGKNSKFLDVKIKELKELEKKWVK